ncbi:MAG TPA: bifunctional phosphoribosylaminoimidazolecarboxamide formyltransferase/IMP cyclohydrolase [Actinomycetota bacterium]|nr:bifunctional phosphoribosylaminoimidazolecarboxamide formyltransferase/IMP cyclohydrolase [Actinomycetota bacterium]
MTIGRALISVSDKGGIIEFARGLVEVGVDIISSGGTAAELADAGLPVTKVADVTGAPEILGGRVKTLHPHIHGGILADRSKPEHMEQLASQGITPIDLVVCNLYPFERTIEHPSVKEEDAIEQIDIGGPAMVRAAAKNWHSVTVVVNPDRYDSILKELTERGEVSFETRRELALEAFQHTAAYDAAIARYFSGGERWPDRIFFAGEKVQELRYGENPHQSAAFYRSAGSSSGLAATEQLGGKELSYNNLLDTDAAWRLVVELDGPAAAIIKHSNPCGVAIGGSLVDAYRKAFECDTTSAFGGIVALNQACDEATASAIAEIFTEVVIAPDYDDAALAVLEGKKNLRILRAPDAPVLDYDVRKIAGGLLVQSADPRDDAMDASVVTKAQPTDEQLRDLRFAWVVAKHVKSNAIVLAKDLTAVGVGAGQMSRVESTELAARRAGDRAQGTVCASDAFFPFRDGLDAAVAAGARAVIQPGGSVRDEEVIAAADEHGIPMLFTGRRHFRH